MSAVSTSAGLCDLRQVATVSECPLSSEDRVTIKLPPSLTLQKMLDSPVSSELLACSSSISHDLLKLKLCNMKLCQQRAPQGQQEESSCSQSSAVSYGQYTPQRLLSVVLYRGRPHLTSLLPGAASHRHILSSGPHLSCRGMASSSTPTPPWGGALCIFIPGTDLSLFNPLLSDVSY